LFTFLVEPRFVIIIIKTNPKAYWRTLKKFSGNDKQNPPISIDTLYEYFKNINNYEEDDDGIEIDHSSVCNNPITCRDPSHHLYSYILV
jgi:hypothetical protein